MKGCLQLHSTPIKRKHALTTSNLSKVILDLANSTDHDDLLFQTLLLTGFFALMCLGELTFPNNVNLRNWRKVTKHSTVKISNDQYELFLIKKKKKSHLHLFPFLFSIFLIIIFLNYLFTSSHHPSSFPFFSSLFL